MGYYTDFIIKCESKDVMNKIEEESGYRFEKWGDGIAFLNAKWYDFEDSIDEVLRAFPKATFSIHGSGEETGDLWKLELTEGKEKFFRGYTEYTEEA